MARFKKTSASKLYHYFWLFALLASSPVIAEDAMLESYEDEVFEEATYVCVASFRSEKRAKAKSTGLNVAGYEVIVRSALVNGSDYYRVLVGPVPADKEFQQEFMQWLSDMGHEGAWVLGGIRDTSSQHLLEAHNKP
ncbi:MAG: SPOR domain-containing protein, partial [Pseudomonadales bacterium]|nr:SPOR domain-containing protein [Pseudomonadales bacterium]